MRIEQGQSGTFELPAYRIIDFDKLYECNLSAYTDGETTIHKDLDNGITVKGEKMFCTLTSGDTVVLNDGVLSIKMSYSTVDFSNSFTATTTAYIKGETIDPPTPSSSYYTKSQTDVLLSGKQETLVSGTNIKTINNTSILGSGNINIEGGSGSSIDYNIYITSAGTEYAPMRSHHTDIFNMMSNGTYKPGMLIILSSGSETYAETYASIDFVSHHTYMSITARYQSNSKTTTWKWKLTSTSLTLDSTDYFYHQARLSAGTNMEITNTGVLNCKLKAGNNITISNSTISTTGLATVAYVDNAVSGITSPKYVLDISGLTTEQMANIYDNPYNYVLVYQRTEGQYIASTDWYYMSSGKIAYYFCDEYKKYRVMFDKTSTSPSVNSSTWAPDKVYYLNRMSADELKQLYTRVKSAAGNNIGGCVFVWQGVSTGVSYIAAKQLLVTDRALLYGIGCFYSVDDKPEIQTEIIEITEDGEIVILNDGEISNKPKKIYYYAPSVQSGYTTTKLVANKEFRKELVNGYFPDAELYMYNESGLHNRTRVISINGTTFKVGDLCEIRNGEIYYPIFSIDENGYITITNS